MEDVRISEGFTEGERARVAALYWEAFERKLRPGFVDETTGRAVLRAALRNSHLLIARQRGQVLGICGFYQAGAGATDLRWSRLRESLSVPAALRASVVLSVLSRSDRVDALVLDGVCVDHEARGRGIGTSLLNAAVDKARRMGVGVVSLSVVDANQRARALYERRGFTPTGRGSLGFLAPLYGFDGYTTMELEVGQ